jgi:hypothetical protein
MSTIQLVEVLQKDLKKLEEEHKNNVKRLEEEYQEAVAKRLRLFQSYIAPAVAPTVSSPAAAAQKKEIPKEVPKEKDELVIDSSDESASLSSSEDEEEESFIQDEEEDVLSGDDDDDEDAPPPPVHYKMKPTSKKRAQKRVERFTDQEEDGDDEDGEDCADPEEVVPDKAAEQQWNTIKKLPYDLQRTSPWFQDRYLNPFEGVRENLGRQGDNDIGNLIWNNIPLRPSFWEFKKIDPFYTKCAFCNSKKRCTMQVDDVVNKREYFFASCCGPLAEAWRNFHQARLYAGSVAKLDNARDAVVTANSKKKKTTNNNNKNKRRRK